MGNKNYQRGVRFERELKKIWETKGYHVLRTAGSHGKFDLICVDSERPIELIQCKVTERLSVAKKMVKEFRENPPLTPTKYFHQSLVVKVDGELISVVV